MNRRARATLARLEKRCTGKGGPPELAEVEAALWRAGDLADRRCGGYWPPGGGLATAFGIEGWTSRMLGWSFPCAEAVYLVRRCMDWPDGRVIDVAVDRWGC